jgi:methylase of polypeptide subunit release factors
MQMSDWDPFDARSWSEALGLAFVPMFPAAEAKKLPGDHAVLMDGQVTSFALSICEDSRELEDWPVSWSWSSDVNHAVVVDSQRNEFFVRRWDYPLVRRFTIPTQAGHAREVVKILKESGALRAPDVISHVLRAFRQVRLALGNQKPIEAVKVFLGLLVAAERVKGGTSLIASAAVSIKTVGELFQALHDFGGAVDELAQIEARTRKVQLGTLLSDFLQRHSLTGCILEPRLLLRHAAGRLFQEANLIVERAEEQSYFAGLAPERSPAGKLDRDVRFTPPTLARTLAERALATMPRIPKKFSAFDPACGSGVFLLEVLRELEARGFDGEVNVNGLDISEVSCLLARFCLNRAASEYKSGKERIKVQISQKDALKSDWPDFNLALMNPPFVPWERMDGDTQDAIRAILGELAQGRSDKAMAFVWKAVQQIEKGKAIGAVIPAPLLETLSGERWRNAISELTEIRLLGKFRGFEYFAASLVEPSFLVLGSRGTQPLPEVKVVLADAGFEDESLRALRLGVETTADAVEGWEIYSAPPERFISANWMPRSQADLTLIQGLSSGALTTIGGLFDVRQGIRSGNDACFILAERQFETLKSKEKVFFRPSATNDTIREGRIFSGEWVFYPYGKDGPTINEEAELRIKVPTYYETRLKPAKTRLQKRAKTDPNRWWLLTWERGWQREKSPKLVSASFGGSGRFACDKAGEFVVVQGHGWLWRKTPIGMDLEGELPNRWFFKSELSSAYLAIFNSKVFERLLALFCPRVQGGQFDLANRFVDKIPIPDLSNVEVVDADTCASLVEFGRRIHAGRSMELEDLECLVARIYRVPLKALR